MRDDTLNEFGGVWSGMRSFARDRMSALASLGFMLLAVGAIQFQEQMSPVLGRLGDVWITQAAKTVRSANLALMSAALPFFLRG